MAAGTDSEREFRLIYERHSREVLRYAIRCVGQRAVAEEMASEAFLRLYRNKENIDTGNAVGWLMTTVKNLARDYWRRSQVELKHLSAISSNSTETPMQWNWDELLQHSLLKPEHRVCLTLKYVHGMERKQIMDHTGLSENQVKNCIQYGLQLLRQVIVPGK